MTNKYVLLAIGLVVGVVLAIGVGLVVSKTAMSPSLGVVGAGQVQTNTFWFYNGFFAGTTQQFSVSSAGAVTTANGLTIGSAGTSISKFSCATATWNPGSLATSTITNATTTDIALPGAVAGDLCSGSLTSATSSAIAVGCNISGSATGTIQLTNLGTTNAAIDLATGTAKVCYTH